VRDGSLRLHTTRADANLGIRGPAEKEGPVRACVAALPRWSGWLYAHQPLWLDPGPDWDEEKVAEFPATVTQVGARREAPVILTVDAAATLSTRPPTASG
jgi:hypothetical protein